MIEVDGDYLILQGQNVRKPQRVRIKEAAERARYLKRDAQWCGKRTLMVDCTYSLLWGLGVQTPQMAEDLANDILRIEAGEAAAELYVEVGGEG